MQQPVVSLSVVTFNNAGIIEQTLASIVREWPQQWPLRVRLIDNCSSDGTAAMLRTFAETLEGVEFVQSERNLGYGGGHNIAIRNTDSRYHVICNPDIRLRTGALEHLANFMDEHTDVGIASPKYFFEDGRHQANNHRLPTILDLFLRRFVPGSLRHHFQRRADYYTMQDIGYDSVVDVPFPSGAFMFCRTGVLHEIAGFDDDFFLYFEDVDLAHRVRQSGYRTVFVPQAEVVHLWARAAHRDWRITWIFIRSAFRYFNKWGYRFS